ncbi:MAG: hypothetical protein GXO74_04855 [Calditrichaeota bacterium]|nr:hypothetical protein [Calditrichota bacterium]
MQNAIQKILFFIVSVALTFFIYWLVFLDKESKSNALDYSINLLGERLLGMVPDSLGKSSVASLYNNFARKVNQREIPPEQVEKVAANILNLTNLDTVLTPAVAAAALNLSTAKTNIAAREKNGQSERQIGMPANIQAPPSSAREWEKLGAKLKEMYQVNQEISDVSRQRKATMPAAVSPPILFHFNKQIRLAVDPAFLKQLEAARDEKLLAKLKKLEKANLLDWAPEVKSNLAEVRAELMEMKKAQQFIQSDSFKNVVKKQTQFSLKVLKKLQNLGIANLGVNLDSLEQAVQKSVAEIDSVKID